MANTEFSDKYWYLGSYDRTIFMSGFIKEFSSSPRFNGDMIPNLNQLLGLIEKDMAITDIRWASYMLATTMWETTSLKNEEVITRNGKHKKVRKWLHTMSPVEEVGHGKGRKYHEPVKVKLLDDGSVRITEHDGDQFKLKSDGKIIPLTKKAKLGAVDGKAASPVYVSDDGVEHEYFGRGYVQLTWWSNYANASIELGLNFSLLLNPDLVKDPDVAYKIMSYGMRTGKIFANSRSFRKYFSNKLTDYNGARAMVNGHDHALDIAKIARKFEVVLLKSKIKL
ncbi:MAG: glycoside hydrolase [Methylococcaceae bacterium]|nr:glycoside hydrolase [Methylococcaceae bacterium]